MWKANEFVHVFWSECFCHVAGVDVICCIESLSMRRSTRYYHSLTPSS